MMQANEALIRQLFDVFRRGNRDEAATLFASDAVFRYPGRGPMPGGWRGRDGILRFWAEQDRCSGGNLRPEMIDLGASDRNVFLFVRFPRVDGSGTWMRVVVYEVSDGAITSAHVFEDDPDAAVAFFSRAG